VPFRDVTHVFLPMNFDVVPRLVFGRTAPRHDFIPFAGAVEFRIDSQNHPVVIELFMMDQLTDAKFRFGFLHGCSWLELKKHSDRIVDLRGNFLFQAFEFLIRYRNHL